MEWELFKTVPFGQYDSSYGTIRCVRYTVGYNGKGLELATYNKAEHYNGSFHASFSDQIAKHTIATPEELDVSKYRYYADVSVGSSYDKKFYFDDLTQSSYYVAVYGDVTARHYCRVYRQRINNAPTIQDSTQKSKTLYDGESLVINGNVLDKDKGDVITIRYSVNNGTTHALASHVSQGTSIPYNKNLMFKDGSLYDGETVVAKGLSDGTKHLIKLWVVDDKGGSSQEVLIDFYVVNNRPAMIEIEQFTEVSGLVDSDTILVKGNVSDPDGHETTLMYKINSSPFTTINKGFDRDFEHRIPVEKLNSGDNSIVFRAVDEYGARTDKTLRLQKDRQVTALNTTVREYKLRPNEGKAKGVLLWIQREVGDLTTKVELKFGDNPYKEIEVSHTAPISESLEEDEYYYEHDTEEEDIRLRITMNRVSTSSDKVIKLISGVFN